MSTDGIFAVTRFGLAFERSRMETASRNIATADVPLVQRTNPAPTANSFTRVLGEVGKTDADSASGPGHLVLDPTNPLAGSDGAIRYPNTDLAHEMTTLMSAQRAYQADIRAFNTLHGMLLKSLSIGGR